MTGGVLLWYGPVWQLRTHADVVDFSATSLPSCPSMGSTSRGRVVEIVTLADPKVSGDIFGDEDEILSGSI